MASLFLRQASGEAYFMCAATILTSRVLVSAAHCFNRNYRDKDWFVRVGDNYIGSRDPSEQTFQVRGKFQTVSAIPCTSGEPDSEA
jgi:V8-like Glu-specific endopeptidase